MTPAFREFLQLVTIGDTDQISWSLASEPSLATHAAGKGATRGDSTPFFFTNIAHFIYAGDTALHIAAAAFKPDVARLLVAHGANCRARNRMGAEPLHYAADANRWDPVAQAETIEFLISIGADPNAVDDRGVSPLHRAVRTRSLDAVRALIEGGADPNMSNQSGSTPLRLAVHTTGRSGSGSLRAKEQQAAIHRFLIEHGAKPG